MAAIPCDLDILKQAFEFYDRDGDGKLGLDEFKSLLMSIDTHMNAEEANQMAESTDVNHDHVIDFDEFTHALLPTPEGLPNLQCWYTSSSLERSSPEDELRACFQAFDYNHDGMISRSELKQVMRRLGECLSEQDVDDMMLEADTNRDGYIDFEEFKRLC
ncbi:EF-hand [Hesseltinella vesiculosa]|uniref:EF-hand n=1 Tax=Hesseltinella vesiculosa TaxID=101127 RepID=A0A1X2GEJ9_9FUNG|nr:EF-hand [Hesseltinella vesiculosa]